MSALMNLILLKNRIKAIGPMMKDPAVPWWKKGIIVLGIAYLLLPFDLIPPIIPVFGFLDDAVLWLFIISYLKDELDKYYDSTVSGGTDLKRQFMDKNIVDNVDFTVSEVEEEDKNGGKG